MYKFNISFFLIVVSLGALAYADRLPVEEVAEKICLKPKSLVKDVTQIQSMTGLASFFGNVPESGHPLSDCKNKYYKSFTLLAQVLTAGNDDICGDAKLSAIENFNRKFLSTTRKDKEEQNKDLLKAPKTVKVFFMHYAFLVSSRCKQNLMKQLDDKKISLANLQTGDMDDLLSLFSKKLAINMSKRGYADLILPWKLVDSLPGTKKDAVFLRDPVIDAEHPLPIRISIRINGAENLYPTQRVCRDVYRPIYSKSILSVMRLVGLGLYESGERLEKMLLEDGELRKMFEVTQLCETLLPVEAFDDASLGENQVVAMTIEKANIWRSENPVDLGSDASQDQVASMVAQESLDGLDELDSLRDSRAAGELARDVTSKRKTHEQVSKRLLRVATMEVKSKLKEAASSFRVTGSDGSTNEILVEGVSGSGDAAGLVRSKRKASAWRYANPFYLAALAFSFILGCIIEVIAFLARILRLREKPRYD